MKNLIITVFAAFISGAFDAFFYDQSIKEIVQPTIEPISNYEYQEDFSSTNV
jgi:uncharacterized protein (DUF2164 family)